MSMMGLIKFEDIFSRVGILQYMNVTDRQTDRRMDRHQPIAKTALMHIVAQ